MKYKQAYINLCTHQSVRSSVYMVPILLCTFFGTWLEKKVSFPVFIPLVIVGVLAGLRNAWVLARHANEDPEDKNKN